MRSLGTRFLIVGLLAVLMYIPIFFVSLVVEDRSRLADRTLAEVGQEWGGAQLLSGPVMILPVQGPVTTSERINVTDPDTGEVTQEQRQVTRIRRTASVYLLPEEFALDITTETEIRSRGLFDVPVFQAIAAMDLTYDLAAAEDQLVGDEEILWEEATLRLTVSANRALRGAAQLSTGETQIPLEPRAGDIAGVMAELGDPRDHDGYALTLGFNGAADLRATPMGRTSTISFTSDWPHPSFYGAFLPNTREITEDGFTATWEIPHLARPLPQAAREDYDTTARSQAAFGVRFFQPNDFYQKAYRAARYGILFIALTFLTVLLIEGATKRPTHPVQYILIGLAQSTFVLLMVSYAEQVGFGPAYLLSAGATTILLTLFGWLGLKLGKRAAILGLMLAVTYGVLYLILRSADYALLAGSTLAFFALALTMYMTRNEDWYGAPRDPTKTIFGTPRHGVPQTPQKTQAQEAPQAPPELPPSPGTS
ncbi:cell envelope integrity protein CreD [Hasllibacter sp. MH4015]|uniref:cell envelope integrity protein CreD n=1 Tax=Hasllibacter sp. MH4015 TaxID=2854029 RepID=UPI001CD41FBB|nr:cell envelope integrity protein CreD [Hasllibacter sp. MH4015]